MAEELMRATVGEYTVVVDWEGKGTQPMLTLTRGGEQLAHEPTVVNYDPVFGPDMDDVAYWARQAERLVQEYE